MAENPVPVRLHDLFTLAEDAADGAHQFEVAIGLKQNDEAAIRAALAAAQAGEHDYQLTITAKSNLYAAQRAADQNARAFITMASSILGHFLGTHWSESWSETGFPNQSTAIPSSIGQRQALLASLATYFTNHPAHANAPLNITAAQATTLFTALSDARSAVNVGLTNRGLKRAARDVARKQLERRLRGLIDELGQLIEDDDPRWLSFGLNMPGAMTTPEGPTDLVLTAVPNYMVYADWHDVPHATHYRVYVQIVGVNPGFVVEPTTFADSNATLGPYQPGQVVRIKVTAVSGGLEGPESDVAELTIGGGSGGA